MQGQANEWIKRMESGSGGGDSKSTQKSIDVVKLSDKSYLRTLENCIQFGTPCLLENVGEELDSVLEGVLLKQTFKQSNVEYVRLGDRMIEYSPDFRLYLTTRLRNPHFLPEWSVKVTLVNCVITRPGLEDQLLGIVTARERPQLEARRGRLIVEGAANRRRLKEIEDQILQILSSSEGNILEDEKAIEVLSSSKLVSEEISKKQEVASVTEQEINEVRDGYKPVAHHGSILYFTISDLANIDPMYQYSLGWFINLYVQSIKNSPASEDLPDRIESLNDYFTKAVYQNVCRSLFEKDKLLFSFLLCIGILKGRGGVNEDVWRFLLTGGIALDVPEPNPAAQWLSDKSWSEMYGASNLESLKGWWQHFSRHTNKWRKIADSKSPHMEIFPGDWNKKLGKLDKLVVIRCLCSEKIVPAVVDFITSHMGASFVDPPAFDLATSFLDSDCVTPLVFIISPGVDPMAALLRFAEARNLSSSDLSTVSLGQGQGPIAEAYIHKNLSNESWVVLQNCHLATSWIPRLGEICEEMTLKRSEVNPGFRLWLTSYPSQEFPVSVLQNSVKMTNEPPRGLRANLLRSFTTPPISTDQIDNQPISTEQGARRYLIGVQRSANLFRRLLYGLCFFHAVVQERRGYGAIGWNIPYEFNDSDLSISVRQLQMFTNEYEEVQLEALTYLTGECNYGGRVTDNQDRRLMTSLLSAVYCPGLLETDLFSLSESGQYRVPGDHSSTASPSSDDDLDYYLAHIRDCIEATVAPEVFGLNPNADIAKQQQETAQLLDGVLLTLPRQTSGEGKSTQSILEDLATDILSKMPQQFNIDDAQTKYPVQYDECMHTVLHQELIRFNRLIAVVRSSLADLRSAVRGQILMSAVLEEVQNSMLVGRLPQHWANHSYPSLKPLGSYVTDLVARIRFFQSWIDNDQPAVFWLSGFYFTQSFLTGVLQNFARRSHQPIDTLDFDYHITSNQDPTSSPSAEGAYVSGLNLECGRWCPEDRCLKESNPKVLFDLLPIIDLLPRTKSGICVDGRYFCPVYKTSARRGVLSTTGHSTNYVMTITLPSREAQTHWINRGLAALCQLSE